jgi:hypothetical protein
MWLPVTLCSFQDGAAWLHVLKTVTKVDAERHVEVSQLLLGYYITWLAPIEDAIQESGARQLASSSSASARYAQMLITATEVLEWARGYERGESKLQKAVSLLCKEAQAAFECNKKASGKKTGHGRKLMRLWGCLRFQVTPAAGSYPPELVGRLLTM